MPVKEGGSMSYKMQRALAGALATGMLASLPAVAGSQFDIGVFILEGLAQGFIGSTRNSSDSVEFLNCFTQGSGIGGCSARDETGLTRSCTTTDPGHLATIRSMRGDTSVQFTWDTSGRCVTIYAAVGSQAPPKLP
jgi:hypothetical protein